MDKLLMTDVLLKLAKYSVIQTDNMVFRLHHKFTAILLIASSLLVSATEFFGDPIHCVSSDIHPVKIVNSYCWVEGTVTLARSLNITPTPHSGYIAAPGVDQMKITDADSVIEHAYYQWVCFFLFLQGVMFYFPRWLWKLWEHGRMRSLINELSKPALEQEKKEQDIAVIAKYFLEHQEENQAYAKKFFFCECLNLVNVIGQIFFVDAFLGYQFRTYGPDTLWFIGQDPEGRIDPMARVFPKMTKCRFRRFGTSGDVQIHDSICLLPLNILNEKIFVFLWFWFVILATVTAASIIYRIFMISAPSYRYRLLNSLATMVEKKDLEYVTDNGRYGEWFMLSMLKDNMKAHHFKDVVATLSNQLQCEHSGVHPGKDLV